MKIEEILQKDSILIDVQAPDKKQLLKELTLFLSDHHNIEESDQIFLQIMDREHDISTGIGFGVAIPHTHSALVTEPVIIAGTIPEGIEYDAIDDRPVSLIFMLVSPIEDNGVHREVLCMLSKILFYEEVRKELIEATTPEDFLQALIAGENKYAKAS